MLVHVLKQILSNCSNVVNILRSKTVLSDLFRYGNV